MAQWSAFQESRCYSLLLLVGVVSFRIIHLELQHRRVCIILRDEDMLGLARSMEQPLPPQALGCPSGCGVSIPKQWALNQVGLLTNGLLE